jgi:hypothetical protein
VTGTATKTGLLKKAALLSVYVVITRHVPAVFPFPPKVAYEALRTERIG